MISTITSQDPTYAMQRRGRNARFPATDADAVARIEICENADDVATALQRALDAGVRPTVRSGGHCYEDFFVNNPKGVLIDVGKLNFVGASPKGGYQVGPGAMLGEVYTKLSALNVDIPAGTCYTVGAGGHLSGGGYGFQTRLQGLCVDWISAVDILTVGANGKVVARHVDKSHDADLFRALRGSGAASYGIVTNYYFEKLPTVPKQFITSGISFPWETMTEEKFIQIAQIYGEYFATRGQEPDTWPMFAMLGLWHKVPGASINIHVWFNDVDGKSDLHIPTEFLDRFLKCGDAHQSEAKPKDLHDHGDERFSTPCVEGKHSYNTNPWLEGMVHHGGQRPYGTTRGKYKSTYMKKNFTTEELKRIYAWLTRDIPNVNTASIIAVDSYGGGVNRPHMAHETAVPQRSSIMKLQYQMYWQNPEEDEARLKYFDAMYTDIYSANVQGKHAGTPFQGEYYEGCYINYPDADMTRYSFWPELYYGDSGLYPHLQATKKKYDPNNIFHHAMTVRT